MYGPPWPDFSIVSPESCTVSQSLPLSLCKVRSILRWQHRAGCSQRGLAWGRRCLRWDMRVAPGSSLSFPSPLSRRGDLLLPSLSRKPRAFPRANRTGSHGVHRALLCLSSLRSYKSRTQLMTPSETPLKLARGTGKSRGVEGLGKAWSRGPNGLSLPISLISPIPLLGFTWQVSLLVLGMPSPDSCIFFLTLWVRREWHCPSESSGSLWWMLDPLTPLRWWSGGADQQPVSHSPRWLRSCWGQTPVFLI